MSTPEDPSPKPRRFPRTGSRRLGILTGLLMALAVLGAAHLIHVRHDEDTLRAYGQQIIEEANAADPEPVSEAGPEADVELEAYCSYAYLVAGKKTGKIRMIIKPRPHAPVQKMTPICYICNYEGGAWHEVESYSEH